MQNPQPRERPEDRQLMQGQMTKAGVGDRDAVAWWFAGDEDN